jgi:predicted P-loop ATPase
MIGAVARIMEPGCKMDTMPVFEGSQGTGKSRFVNVLAGDWYSDTMPSFRGKDAMLALQGVWIFEIPELEALSKSRIDATKAFLSRQVDNFRRPYGRTTEPHKRQCVLIGTTNEDDYLRDPTGARRFWPIACEEISIDRLIQDRDQLWAEAVEKYRRGEAWHLTDEEEALAAAEQKYRQPDEPWADRIDGFVWAKAEVTIAEVLDTITPELGRQGHREYLRVSRYLKRWGWVRARTSTSGRSYRRPATIPPEKIRFLDGSAEPPPVVLGESSAMPLMSRPVKDWSDVQRVLASTSPLSSVFERTDPWKHQEQLVSRNSL